MAQITFTELAKANSPSGTLWRGFAAPEQFGPWGSTQFSQSGNPAFGFYDDFLAYSKTTLVGPYAILETSTAWSKIADTAANKGILSAVMNSSAEDENILKWGSALSAPFQFGGNDLVFECSVALSDITASKNSFFCGLASAASITTDQLLVDTTGIPYATQDYVGFLKTYADAGLVDGSYLESGSTRQDGATKTKLDSLHTFEASATTYVKLGFRYRAHPKKVEWFVDGTLAGTASAPAMITAAEIDASTFPNAATSFFAPYVGIKDTAGDQACTLNVDWWACAQLL